MKSQHPLQPGVHHRHTTDGFSVNNRWKHAARGVVKGCKVGEDKERRTTHGQTQTYQCKAAGTCRYTS
eukprot:1156426-Pelagomonas_calceolata.AAC.3